MDLKQLTYIVTIAEEQSITHAAEKLFITQSALNQQLLKLESELGTQLFHRSRNELTLTEAGRIYVEYARRILALKKEAYDTLNDLTDNRIGSISVGLTPERGISMFPSVFSRFHKQYPHVRVIPNELSVKKQQALINAGQLDFGFVTLSDIDKSNNEYMHISKENLFLAVNRSHPMAKNAPPPGQDFATADLADFKDEQFVLMFKYSTQRSVIDPLFEKAGFAPNILFETASNLTLCNMVKNNLSCAIISQHYTLFQDDIAYFYLPEKPMWDLYVTYRKGQYLTKAARTFIAMAVDYYRDCPVAKLPILP